MGDTAALPAPDAPPEALPVPPMTLNMNALGLGLTPDRSTAILTTGNHIATASLPMNPDQVDELIKSLQGLRADMVGGGLVAAPNGFKVDR